MRPSPEGSGYKLCDTTTESIVLAALLTMMIVLEASVSALHAKESIVMSSYFGNSRGTPKIVNAIPSFVVDVADGCQNNRRV